jgi:predicted phage terminase large subunit-like protein
MKMPWMRYIAAAYTSSLTQRDNGRCLRIILDPDYQANWSDQFGMVKIGAKKIENDRTGWKLATSVEGVGTGERGNRIIIDDPNNPRDVESDIVREGTNLWLREVMPDRLNNMKEGVIVVIQQRTHEHDASGTLLDVMGRDYVHLCVPMEYEPSRHCVTAIGWEDPRGLDEHNKRLPGFVTDENGDLTGDIIEDSPAAQQAGRLAWSARFPRDVCDNLRQVKGAYSWSGQYNQLPVPRGGGLIQRQWWQLWRNERFPDFGSIIASLDTAIKEEEENDWNALTVWGAFPDEDEAPLLMLRMAWRMRGSLGELAHKAGETCKQLGVDTLLIEDKTRGHDTAAEIRRLFGAANFTTVLVPPAGDKVSRVIACQPLWSGDALSLDAKTGIAVWGGGVIYAPGTEWAEEVIDECAKFPRAEHDDYVDSATQALLWMRRNGVVLRKVEFAAEEFERRKFESIKRLTTNTLAERYNI